MEPLPTSTPPPRPPAEKWQKKAAGERYRAQRWGGRRRGRTDPRLVAELLSKLELGSGPGGEPARVLDAACGPGRLRGAIEAAPATWIGLDASAAMLSGIEDTARPTHRLLGRVERLPFADRTFDAVVACRLLHHYRDDAALCNALAELVRVSDRWVVASFWDAASWPGVRRRLGLARDEGPEGRGAVSRARLAALAADAGARVARWRPVARYLSQQTFVVLERTDAPR